MKDLYELLMDIEIDENEIKELEEQTMEINELERRRIKKNVKQAIKRQVQARKQKFNHNKGIIAAAIAGVVVCGTLGIGIFNPSYAAELPIVGDIFRFLDNGRTGIYDLYKENAYEINVTKESNGIEMTIKDAIFDGKTITYTYEIKTSLDLGERPLIGVGPKLSVMDYEGGMTGGGSLEKISEGIYVGQDSYTLSSDRRDEVVCRLKINEIRLTGSEELEPIKVKFKFNFSLKAIQSEVKQVNRAVEEDGFKITLNSIYQSPMSVVVEYTQEVPEEYRTEWDDVSTVLELKDDLGNVYEGEINGGSGKIDTGSMNFSMTFGKIDENASQLIITPKVYCSTHKGGVAIDKDGNETSLTPNKTKEDRSFYMEEIVVDLK